MLEKVGFKNFLALRNVELTLEPFTVIVGPNASGKSSILEGIRRITGSVRDGWQVFLHGNSAENANVKDFQKISFRGSSIQEIEFSFCVLISDTEFNNSLKLSIENNFIRPDWKLHPAHPIFTSKMIIFSKNESARPSYSENLNPYLENTGSGLATVCSFIQSLKPEKFSWIQEKMRQIISNFQRFRIEPAKVEAKDWFNISNENKYIEDIISRRTGTGHQLIFDFENATNVSVEYVSEGTLFALTVLVAVASSEGDTIILIDDLERGLHPKAVRDLMKALRDIQAIRSEEHTSELSHG